MIRQGAWADERGFTLVEVMITIIVMGIVFAIASSTWFGVVESRRVDSGTNHLVSDLRLAHTRATNRLEQWQVVLVANSSAYTIGPTAEPRDLDDNPGDKVVVDTGGTITFEPDGSVTLPGGASSATFIVSSPDGAPAHDIQIDGTISRIQIDP